MNVEIPTRAMTGPEHAADRTHRALLLRRALDAVDLDAVDLDTVHPCGER